MTMRYKCEKCEQRFPIDISDFCPDCPACGSMAVRLEVTPSEGSDHLDDDNLRHGDTSEADHGLRDLPVSDVLLFLGALWLITNDFE